jgi:bifunctional DNase/RNase
MPGENDDEDYIYARISQVGHLDKVGVEGVLVLLSLDGREFPMRAFSGEVAQHISRFKNGDKTTIPTIYNLVEEIAVMQDLLLLKVKVYQSGSVLRANLYFKKREGELVLRNYRASDAIALAAYYDAPILVRKSLFELDDGLTQEEREKLSQHGQE